MQNTTHAVWSALVLAEAAASMVANRTHAAASKT